MCQRKNPIIGHLRSERLRNAGSNPAVASANTYFLYKLEIIEMEKIKLWILSIWYNCPKCHIGRVLYDHTERIGTTDIDVLICNKCKTEFI